MCQKANDIRWHASKKGAREPIAAAGIRGYIRIVASDRGGSGAGVEGRLESWKEIAAHFNRSVRTAIRWEREESLPVHRHQHEKRGSVFAYKHELDAWFAERKESPQRRRSWAWVFFGGGLAALAFVMVVWLNYARGGGLGSVAVVPLIDGQGGDSTEAAVSQLSEDLTRILSRELDGAAKAVRYRSKFPDIQEDAILLVRLIDGDGTYSVNAELTNTKDNTLIWSQRYESPSGSLSGIGERISKDLAPRILRTQPAPRAQLAGRPVTANAEAYREYLHGRHEWNKRTAEGMEKALVHFRNAIDLDPAYAQAYAGLGETYALQSYYAPLPPSDTMPKARAAALKAISINSALAEAYAVLAYVEMDYYWDWESAERNFRRAVELDPGWADGHHWFAEFLVAMGRYEEAVAEYRRALELDPLSPIINTNLAHAYYFSKDYRQAAEQCQRAVRLAPDFANAHADLGRAYLFLGRHQEAVVEIETAARLGGGVMNGLGRLGFAYAKAGRIEDARRILANLLEERRKGWNADLALSLVLAGLGDAEKSVSWLERARQERAPYLRMAWNDPAFEALRSHPGFNALLKAMRLPPAAASPQQG